MLKHERHEIRKTRKNRRTRKWLNLSCFSTLSTYRVSKLAPKLKYSYLAQRRLTKSQTIPQILAEGGHMLGLENHGVEFQGDQTGKSIFGQPVEKGDQG